MSAELYQGRRKKDGSCEILADGKPLSIGPSLRVWNHSPTGFEWGYGGSGPAQTALAILLDYLGMKKRDFCERFHQTFKREFIQGAPKPGWVINGKKITDFVTRMAAEEEALSRPLCNECLCEKAMHSESGRCMTKRCICGRVARAVKAGVAA